MQTELLVGQKDVYGNILLSVIQFNLKLVVSNLCFSTLCRFCCFCSTAGTDVCSVDSGRPDTPDTDESSEVVSLYAVRLLLLMCFGDILGTYNQSTCSFMLPYAYCQVKIDLTKRN